MVTKFLFQLASGFIAARPFKQATPWYSLEAQRRGTAFPGGPATPGFEVPQCPRADLFRVNIELSGATRFIAAWRFASAAS